jgi:hypothetical protein
MFKSKINKNLWFKASENEINYFNNLKLDIKYSINYTENKTYNINDYKIKYIIFSTDIVKNKNTYRISYEGSCSFCGYGNDRYIIFQFENGDYGYLPFWNRCLTYHTNESNYIIEVANTLNSIIKYCMTENIRKLYFESINNVNNLFLMLNQYLHSNLVKMTLQYYFTDCPDHDNFP